jgi:hypothetical protein
LSSLPGAGVLTADLRRYLPDVRAAITRRGDRVTWRYGSKVAVAIDEGDVYRVQLDARFASLQDSRHDTLTAGNIAKSIAGHLDPQKSTPV